MLHLDCVMHIADYFFYIDMNTAEKNLFNQPLPAYRLK